MDKPYMTPDTRELLAVLMAIGVRNLARNGEKLALDVPDGVLTPAIRDRIVAHRRELLAWVDDMERRKRIEHEAPEGGAQ